MAQTPHTNIRVQAVQVPPFRNMSTQALHPVPPSHVVSTFTILRCLGIPDELILYILAIAEYYAREVSHRRKRVTFRANSHFNGVINDSEPSMAGLYMTASVPHNRIRSVAFTMKSRDQAWADNGGHGTYHNSHTWFEASILQRVVGHGQSDHDLVLPLEHPNGEPVTFRSVYAARDYLRQHGWDFKFGDGDNLKYTWKVHHNVTAMNEFREYNVRWVKGEKMLVVPEGEGMGIGIGDGEGFVESLQPGNMVLLWARAEQFAWVHIVDEATIVTEYEVL
ncbi:hypothetical protein E1B28_013651 [Marasmius oreades]|uniref:Uncharacterized protein n=1 Tax=Marasmius oreades TaxID=181124 RepID=A0A9P7RQ83_9AGAR|nr:uncharacterized protein E1B28_013651 [Marasmius oreades]KAG7087704.1 hypothetical protein E1B28_013651 [Marasmius oreades]